jgi:hypothetical protein
MPPGTLQKRSATCLVTSVVAKQNVSKSFFFNYTFTVSANQEQATPSKSACEGQLPLFTIGYGTRSVDQLIAILKSNGIELLLDVRSSPYSKFKPEFSKEILRLRLERAQIRYLFVGDTLGGRSLRTRRATQMAKWITIRYAPSRFSMKGSPVCAMHSSSSGLWL